MCAWFFGSALMQVTIEHRNRFGPQGTGAFFAAFTYESDLDRLVQTQIVKIKRNDFTDARTGVVQKHKQGHVSHTGT